ncbi:hypothetical protein CBR_g38526 [Chara braunii]|uniref:Uncharacterized protein n=1 Tax=Chara braunii TaxID=69332 RepID=A0A388JP66_CHABU|nr:hypothetical protein CBR_g38526 [Chara braunii]|eukprot:GBG59502.1 hypothetical protein CBR_g38526 [Chara braunii]
MDELIRQEIERNSEAVEARVMMKIGRQYLVTQGEAQREEGRSPACKASVTPIREGGRYAVEFEDYGIEDIEDEIAKLYEMRERKMRGKEPVQVTRRLFQQPVFHRDDGSVDNLRLASSEMGAERARTKIIAGSGPEGLLN